MLPISRAGNFPQTMYFLHLHVWNGPFREVTKLKITVRMNYAPVSAYRMNSLRSQSMNEGTTMKIKFHRIDEWSMKVCVDRSGYECSSEWSIWSTFRRSDLVNVFYFSPTKTHIYSCTRLASDRPTLFAYTPDTHRGAVHGLFIKSKKVNILPLLTVFFFFKMIAIKRKLTLFLSNAPHADGFFVGFVREIAGISRVRARSTERQSNTMEFSLRPIPAVCTFSMLMKTTRR